MVITKHFTLEEFAQPARPGFEHVPYPAEWIEERLRPLCEALEILRAELGDRPMRVLSGYRTEGFNRAVGGTPSSQHLHGRAADFTVDGLTSRQVLTQARLLYKAGKLRLGGLGLYPEFVHVDVRGGRVMRWSGTRSRRQTAGLGLGD
ncbi:MAG: DUF882 domain-containing protein [Deltaproteobacteria bacterium]|nr:DUF882 domain-containing protein [Deltaproteobacteria bacterium]